MAFFSLTTVVAIAWLTQYADAAITITSGATASGTTAAGTATVAEDLSAGSTIFTIVATTNQAGITYAFTASGNPDTAAEIDSSVAGTATVKLASGKNLDREAGATVDFVLTADDTDATITITVTVTLTDVNEMDPVFASSKTLVCVADATATSTAITSMVATDGDATENTITYTLPAGNTGTDFAISAAGAVTTANALATSRTASYTIDIVATDAGTSPGTKSSTATLYVHVGDCPIPCTNGVMATTSWSLAILLAFASIRFL